MRRSVLLLTVAAALSTAAPAAAAVRYASPTSSVNSGSCATALTACTLTYAVNAASSGAEVVVASGTYNVTTTLALPAGPTSIHGVAGSARPVINTTAATSGLKSGWPGVSHLKDLEINGPSTNGLVYLNGDGALVENLVVRAAGANARAIVEYGISGVTTVRDTLATATGTNAIAMWFGGQVSHVRNVTAWATGTGSTGVFAYSNHFLVSGVCNGQGAGKVDLLSSIVHGDGKDLQLTKVGSCGPAASLAISWSDFTTKGESGATIDTSGGHNVSPASSAVFVAPGTDFHQLPGAPTIDAGFADASTGTQDVDDLPRVQGVVDMGAAEFFSPEMTLLPSTAGPTFTGAVNPRGIPTTAVFEFGPTTSYGSLSDAVVIAPDNAIHGVSVTPPGLDPAATYHVRLKVTQGNANYARTAVSADGTYTPPPAVTPPPAATPAPVVAKKPRCKVPKLKGLTRSGARKRLLRAHCAIGKVRGRKGGKVRSQGKKAGKYLPGGTKVSVTLR